MRTSLNEIKKIEDYLHKKTDLADRLLFEANMVLNKDLNEKVEMQKEVCQLVNIYGRKRLKVELEAIHHQLFNDQEHISFRNSILRLFSNNP